MRNSAWWWVAALLVAGGCKSEEPVGNTDGDADSDSDSDSDSDADGDGDADSVTVHVYTQDRRGDRQPAPGATVAFDLPSGTRVEQTADAEGRVTFDRVDWSSGDTAAVIAHLDGWQLGGITAMTEAYVAQMSEPTGELMVVLGLNPASREGLVEVSGTVDLIDSSHSIGVYTMRPGWSYQSAIPDWRVLVPPGEPFTLVAIEYEGGVVGSRFEQPLEAWAVFEHDSIVGPTTMNLDMAESVEPALFSGSLVAPGDTTSTFFQGASPYVIVGSLAGFGMFAAVQWTEATRSGPGFGAVGAPTMVDGGDAPTWLYQGEYIELAAVPDPATLYWWSDTGLASLPDRTSNVVVPGNPIDGPQDLVFPEPPVLVSPPAPEAYRLGELLAWELSDRDAAAPALEVVLAVLADNEFDALITMFAPPGTTSARLPLPPSDTDPAVLLGEAGQAHVALCEPDADRRACLRYAQGQFFEVVP